MDVQEKTLEEVRAFDQFYAVRIGVLDERQNAGDHTPAELRVLCELGHRRGLTAGQLGRELRLDASHISRILRRLVERGEVIRRTSDKDGRVNALGLTARGRGAFETLQRAKQAAIAAVMQALPPTEQAAVVAAMRRIRRAFEGAAAEPGLRPLGPGDLGWIVHRHGVLYAEEYGDDVATEQVIRLLGHLDEACAGIGMPAIRSNVGRQASRRRPVGTSVIARLPGFVSRHVDRMGPARRPTGRCSRSSSG